MIVDLFKQIFRRKFIFYNCRHILSSSYAFMGQIFLSVHIIAIFCLQHISQSIRELETYNLFQPILCEITFLYMSHMLGL